MRPRISRQTFIRFLLFGIGAALAVAIYWLYGIDSETKGAYQPVTNLLRVQWIHPDYKNNWIMPVLSAYVIWLRRRDLAAAPKSGSWMGALLVVLSLLAHVVGFRSQLPRISLISSVFVFWGLAWAVWGRATARILFFPAAYCLLCCTTSLLVEITMPLRLLASRLACVLLHGIGVSAVARGTVVVSSAGGGFQFDVADACSGLRSLTVMTALAAPYAYFTQRSAWKALLLFALSVPLAMVANALRIFTLGAVAEWIGMKLAMQLYHDLSGYIVFFLSIGLLALTGNFLDRNWKEKLCALKSRKRFRR